MRIIAKIDGVPADRVFHNIDERLDACKRASMVFSSTFEMTGIRGFKIAADREAAKAHYISELIKRNHNLYCIITRGYGLN